MSRALIVLAIFALSVFPTFLRAQAAQTPADLPVIQGPVLLTISGLDAGRFPGGQMLFDRNMLMALGMSEIETSSIWTEGRHRYGGVLMRDLLQFLGLADAPATLRLHALNDYRVELGTGDVTPEAPLLAFLQDGLPMSVREKGPIWVIYPYDSAAEFRTETIYSRSIWQLDRIEVLP